MRKRIKRTVVGLLMIAGLLCCWGGSVYAETTVAATQEAGSATEQVSAMLLALNTEEPDKEAVAAARAAYEALSMAQKMRVEGYDRLLAAERNLPQETTATQETVPINTEEPDKEAQKSGTQYSFRLNQYLTQVTLTIRYQTDENADGRMDAPIITLTAPDGQKIEIKETQSFKAEQWNITTSVEPSAAKINVLRGMHGTWAVTTSNRVVFVLSDIEMPTESETFEEISSEPETTAQNEPSDEPQKAKSGGLMALILFLAFVVAVFIGLKKLPQIMNKKTTAQKEEKAKKEAEKKERDDKEMADFIAEWKKMQAEYADPEPEPKKQEKASKPEDDDRLMETAKPDDDSDIEKIDMFDPFAKSRL